MRFVLALLVLCTSLVHARTPIDTIAMERSDSGSRYVKIHAALPREQILYTRFTPYSMPANSATELVDSSRGVGTVYAPVAVSPTRYILNMTAFASASINWAYSLKVDTTTLFSATATGANIQIRDLEIYADTARDKLYMRRTVISGSATATVIDSAGFSGWGVANRISWKLTPSGAATLLGVLGGIQR